MHRKLEPKLITVLREGYTLSRFQGDLMGGLTVGIVALPLSIALAIASGVKTPVANGIPGDATIGICRSDRCRKLRS